MEFEKSAAPTPAAPQSADIPLSEQLVGDDKPFKTIEDLAKGKFEADNFIEQLKAENAKMLSTISELEAETSKGSTISQVLDAVRQLSESGSPQDPPTGGEVPIDGNHPGLSEEDIRALVSRTLKQNETAKQQDSNYESVRAAFQKQYSDPDKARLQYKAVADGLGITEEQLDDFSKMNPELVIRAAGLKQVFKSTTTPPSYLANSENSEVAQANTADGHKDNEWWEQQRKTKGNAWYFSPSTQQKYWKDVNALGDSFFK